MQQFLAFPLNIDQALRHETLLAAVATTKPDLTRNVAASAKVHRIELRQISTRAGADRGPAGQLDLKPQHDRCRGEDWRHDLRQRPRTVRSGGGAQPRATAIGNRPQTVRGRREDCVSTPRGPRRGLSSQPVRSRKAVCFRHFKPRPVIERAGVDEEPYVKNAFVADGADAVARRVEDAGQVRKIQSHGRPHELGKRREERSSPCRSCSRTTSRRFSANILSVAFERVRRSS